MAAEQKELGNAEFKAGNYEKAISFFTKSIELGGDHVLYSNRSACYAGLGKWDEALKDAESCIETRPSARYGKAVASGATSLMAPPHSSRSKLAQSRVR